MSVTWPIDLSSDVGKVRTLIPDKNQTWFAFQDEEIEVFLDIEGSVKSATALALETIASDIAMVDKVIQTLDLKTDGAKTAEALLARAKLLRESDETDEAGIGILEYGDLTVFNANEYRFKKGVYAKDYFGVSS